MHLLGTKLVRNGSFSEQYSAHVHSNGDVMVEVGAPGDVTDTHFLVFPAEALPWLAQMVAKGLRIVVDEPPASPPTPRFKVIDGGFQNQVGGSR
jgi:hypothetical protein